MLSEHTAIGIDDIHLSFVVLCEGVEEIPIETGFLAFDVVEIIIVFASIFIIASVIAFIVYFFLPENLQIELSSLKNIIVFGVIIVSSIMIYLAKTKNIIKIFASYVIFMAFIMASSLHFCFIQN